MSIFGEESIFTLSEDTFPPGHELGRSVRRFPVAMWWPARAKVALGCKPSSQSQEGSPGFWQPQLGLLPLMTFSVTLTEAAAAEEDSPTPLLLPPDLGFPCPLITLLLILFHFIFASGNSVSLCSPGCAGTCSKDQVDLELRDPLKCWD